MAHGYFKASGKLMATMVRGVVGTQHAAMAVYNAWCDRVPVVVISGNEADASHRPPGVPTVHSAQDGNALLRDFTKWDDAPCRPPTFGQSMVRAYKLAMTPPYEPVALSLDAGLQESFLNESHHLTIPRYFVATPPQGDTNAVREARNGWSPPSVRSSWSIAPRARPPASHCSSSSRSAERAGHRSTCADEFPQYALPESNRAQGRAAVGGRRDTRAWSYRLLGVVNAFVTTRRSCRNASPRNK